MLSKRNGIMSLNGLIDERIRSTFYTDLIIKEKY